MLNKYWRDAAERVSWTIAAAGVASAAVYVSDLPPAWVPVGTVIVTVLKTLIAGHVGNPDTAKFDKKDPS
jgi:hypothetical protein